MTPRIRSGAFGLVAVSSLAVLLAFTADASPDRPSPERFMKHLDFLSSHAMQGRGNGTPELDRAADYIANEFAAYGLTPRSFRSSRSLRNVLAAIPGTDPGARHEWLIIGAHYDNLGLGWEHGSTHAGEIHHGADDNASGTAGLLELARVLAQSRPALKRSVMFAAFAGEEIGLIGSSHS